MDIYKYFANCSSSRLDPDESNYLTSISLEEHRSLKEILNACKGNGIDFPFFSDFYLSCDQVDKMLEIFLSHSSMIEPDLFSSRVYEKIVSQLERASKARAGVIGYCD